MDRTFSPQPAMDETFDSHAHRYNLPPSPLSAAYSPGMNRTYSGTDNSFSSGGSYSPPRDMYPPPAASTPQQGRQLDATYSPGMDRTYSGTDHSFSSSSSYSPPRGSPRMDRTFSPPRMERTFSPPRMDGTFSPQRGSPPRMDRTFSPQRGSPPRMDRTFSPQRGSSPRMDTTFSPQRGIPWMDNTHSSEMNHNISDRTFSDRTYYGPEESNSFTSYSDEAESAFQYLMDESPLFETDESFEDDVFDEGDFPMVLQQGYSPNYGPYKDLVLDRGYYPAHLQAGAENYDPMAFFLQSPEREPARSDEIVWRRTSPQSPQSPGFHVLPYKYYYSPEPYADVNFRNYETKLSTAYGTKTATPSRQSPPRAAVGTVKLSPRTPAISKFSRFGYTDPRAKVLNIPPGDDLDVPSAIKRTVTLTSPGRAKPLHLNVQVAPKSISQSPSGEHILCDIAVGVEEAVIKPRRRAGYFTPPVTETVRRYDRKHGMFTPRSVFKKGHYAIRNIFDAPPPETSYERPTPLNTTIEWEHDYLNRMYGAGPSGAGLNTTFTRSPSPGAQALNRTFDAGPSGAGLNTTFTRASPPGAQGLNRTFDAGPYGAGLNTTFTRSPSPGTQGLNRTFDAGPYGAGLNTTFSMASSPRSQGWNRTFDSSNGYEADGYQTPSYQEPEHPVWTYPMRKKQIAASPAQDLITAVEDVGFDYYPTPSSPSPRRYYPETN